MSEEEEVRDGLRRVAPTLTVPPDRLARLARGVQRAQRRRRFAAAAATVVAVVTAIGVTTVAVRGARPRPSSVGAVPTVSATIATPRCPDQWKPSESSAATPKALPTDAAAVTLCAVGGPLFDPASEWGESHQPRMLHTNVSVMLAALNVNYPERFCGTGSSWPGGWWQYAFVVSYPDGTDIPVWPAACQPPGGPVDTFLLLYREQLASATDPASIPTPECPERYEFAQLDVEHSVGFPRDGIGVNRGNDLAGDPSYQPYLPSPLAAVSVCRYQRFGGGFSLESAQPVRDRLDAVRDTLNTAVPLPRPDYDRNLNPNSQLPRCPSVPPAHTSLTVVLVADVTAAISELRVYQAPPCAATNAGIGPFGVIDGVDAGLATWLASVG